MKLRNSLLVRINDHETSCGRIDVIHCVLDYLSSMHFEG